MSANLKRVWICLKCRTLNVQGDLDAETLRCRVCWFVTPETLAGSKTDQSKGPNPRTTWTS